MWAQVCNFSPYTRPFEVMYPSASHVPVLPPDRYATLRRRA